MHAIARSTLLLACCVWPALAAAQSPAPPLPTAGNEAIAPGDSARPETIERLLEATGAERLYSALMDTTLSRLEATPQLAPYAENLREFFARYAPYDSAKADYIEAYRATFTESDLEQLLAFYQSPVGQRLLSKLPRILSVTTQRRTARLQAHWGELMSAVAASAESTASAQPPEQ